MLENIFTNVFGRSKAKSRNSQSDVPGQSPSSSQMPQMPQPPSLPYPPAPYPGASNLPPTSYYPSLPFSQPPSMPAPYGGSGGGPAVSPGYGTLAPSQISPIDSVPFEISLPITNSKNLVSLESIFREIKQAGDVVDRVDAYLRSNQSDYDFKTEQGLIYE